MLRASPSLLLALAFALPALSGCGPSTDSARVSHSQAHVASGESLPPPDPAAASVASAASSPDPAPCSRGYEGGAILDALHAEERELLRCYRPLLERDPDLQGGMFLALTVGPEGQVESAELRADSIHDEGLHACVLGHLRGLRLPAGGPGVVHHMVAFAPSVALAPASALTAPSAGSGASAAEGTEPRRGTLSRSQIRATIRAHVDEVRACYEPMLPIHPELYGRLVTSFIIAPDGHVQSSAIRSSTLSCPVVEDCILGATLRWKFPEPQGGGVVGVNYPFVLTSTPPEQPASEPSE